MARGSDTATAAAARGRTTTGKFLKAIAFSKANPTRVLRQLRNPACSPDTRVHEVGPPRPLRGHPRYPRPVGRGAGASCMLRKILGLSGERKPGFATPDRPLRPLLAPVVPPLGDREKLVSQAAIRGRDSRPPCSRGILPTRPARRCTGGVWPGTA